jgi:hypothetical protein
MLLRLRQRATYGTLAPDCLSIGVSFRYLVNALRAEIRLTQDLISDKTIGPRGFMIAY